MREELLIRAIRNFLRRENFGNLLEAFNDGDITREEFDNQIRDNENKFVVDVTPEASPEELAIIIDLVDKIGLDIIELSTSDVSEMFSVVDRFEWRPLFKNAKPMVGKEWDILDKMFSETFSKTPTRL